MIDRRPKNGVQGNKLDLDAYIDPRARGSALSLREVVTRRAIVQALAALGDARAVPILIGQWNQDEMLSYEVARAVAWCRDADPAAAPLADAFGDALVRNLTHVQTQPRQAAVVALSLGILYERPGPSKLSRLVDGWSYTTQPSMPYGKPNGADGDFPVPRREIHALSNPFFFKTILDGLEGQW